MFMLIMVRNILHCSYFQVNYMAVVPASFCYSHEWYLKMCGIAKL